MEKRWIGVSAAGASILGAGMSVFVSVLVAVVEAGAAA